MSKSKVYVSARAKYRMDDVRKIVKTFQKAGYEVVYDWTDSDVKLPYREPKHRIHNLPVHEKMLASAASTDIYVLMDDEGLRGAYIEFGVFLHDCLKRPQGRRAYIVGPESHKRQSIFESPSFIKFCDTIEGVYNDLGI